MYGARYCQCALFHGVRTTMSNYALYLSVIRTYVLNSDRGTRVIPTPAWCDP